MIYRFLSTLPPIPPNKNIHVGKITKNWDFERFGGCWCVGCLGMNGLNAPKGIRNEKVRFYFTEEGFHRFGGEILADARKQNVPVKVIRRKNPKSSQVVYQDHWQVAILPDKKD